MQCYYSSIESSQIFLLYQNIIPKTITPKRSWSREIAFSLKHYLQFTFYVGNGGFLMIKSIKSGDNSTRSHFHLPSIPQPAHIHPPLSLWLLDSLSRCLSLSVSRFQFASMCSRLVLILIPFLPRCLSPLSLLPPISISISHSQ